MFTYFSRNQNKKSNILLPKYFENVLNRENKFVPNIQTLLISENIFSTICLKNSSEKIYFHERS